MASGPPVRPGRPTAAVRRVDTTGKKLDVVANMVDGFIFSDAISDAEWSAFDESLADLWRTLCASGADADLFEDMYHSIRTNTWNAKQYQEHYPGVSDHCDNLLGDARDGLDDVRACLGRVIDRGN